LSWRGWIVVLAPTCLMACLVIARVYPFLAVTQRADAHVLVVEGWVHEYAIRAAANEFRSGSYELVFTTGGPIEGTGGYINDFNTAASVGADLLKKNGIGTDVLQMVPSRVNDRDRTYSSAAALGQWLRAHDVLVGSVNVVTEGTHARRTRLLFQEALGAGVKVGVIAVPDPDYDARHWWRYSQGVKDIVNEAVAYLYAKFFFWPHRGT